MAFQERAGFFLGRLRDDLLRQHPVVSPRSRFYFSRVPQNIGLVVGDGAALRIWYRDSTLRGGFLSEYRPRDPGVVSAGRDFFLRYDSTATWVEVVKGPEDLAAARAANPEWETDHRELALALGRAGDWSGAIGELEKLAAAAPSSTEYPLNLGILYERTGNLDRARHWYGRAAAMPGGSPAARAALVDLDARVRDQPGKRPPPSKAGAPKGR
jgi:tetratricopeptide (TPR) repeat protein